MDLKLKSMMIRKIHIWLVVFVCLVHHLDASKLKTQESGQLSGRRHQPSKPITEADLNELCGKALMMSSTGKYFTWMVCISSGEGPHKVSCGGALISEQYVLTAAQCVIDQTNGQKKQANKFSVHLVYDYVLNDVIKEGYKVSKVFSHHKFNRTTYKNDIALLRLKEPVELNEFISPVCLPTPSMVIKDTKPTIASRGVVNGYPALIPFPRHYEKVILRSTTECRKVFKNDISKSQLCAGSYKDGKGSCYGEEGGPLMLANATNGRFSAIGIVSKVQCGKPGFVDIYTKVTSYLRWIKKKAQIV